jgi:hypothetical protein
LLFNLLAHGPSAGREGSLIPHQTPFVFQEKVKMSFKKTGEVPIFRNLWELALGTIKNFGSLESRAEKSLGRHKRVFQRWVMKITVMGLSIFMSLAFLVIGLFFIAMDYGGIPRGVVFTCGGLLGLLVLGWMIQSME